MLPHGIPEADIDRTGNNEVSLTRSKDAIDFSIGEPEIFHQMSMLNTADEGIQNLINAVSKVIGGERESEAPKRGSPFPKRYVHNGEAISCARLEEALMRSCDACKSADGPVLHRLRRVNVGLEHAELVRCHP